MNRIYADVLMDARRPDEAIAQYKRTLELDPTFPTTYAFLGRAYEAKGMYDEAVAMYADAGKLTGLPPEILAKANQVYAKSGWKAYLQESLDQILRQPGNRKFPPFVIATYYSRLGKTEEALEWLQRGYDERDFRMTMISVAWEFDNIRSDPRFVALVRKIGLPD
jgi:tetratricopeptide (TPR) repeat protein